MTQIIKTSGVIQNYEGRPILTAVNKTPFFLLDARRYEYKQGEELDEVVAIGDLSPHYLTLKKTRDAAYGTRFSRDVIPSFQFDKNSSLLNQDYFTVEPTPIAAVTVYRINTPPALGSDVEAIYSLGYPNTNRLLFGTLGTSTLINWVGNASGTGHRRKTVIGEWIVEVHYYDGNSSRIIDGKGVISNVSLEETPGVNSIALGGNTQTPNDMDISIAYLAVYSSKLTEEDLYNLFYEAKNNFNLL